MLTAMVCSSVGGRWSAVGSWRSAVGSDKYVEIFTAYCLLLTIYWPLPTLSAILSFALRLRGLARASCSLASIGFLVMIWSRAGCSLPP